jgi:hypothetical protein
MWGGWSGCRIQHAVPEVGRLQTECGEQPVANVIISRYTEGKMQHTQRTHGEHSSEWDWCFGNRIFNQSWEFFPSWVKFLEQGTAQSDAPTRTERLNWSETRI